MYLLKSNIYPVKSQNGEVLKSVKIVSSIMEYLLTAKAVVTLIFLFNLLTFWDKHYFVYIKSAFDVCKLIYAVHICYKVIWVSPVWTTILTVYHSQCDFPYLFPLLSLSLKHNLKIYFLLASQKTSAVKYNNEVLQCEEILKMLCMLSDRSQAQKSTNTDLIHMKFSEYVIQCKKKAD